MIITLNGHTKVQGNRLEMVQDFNCIIQTLMEDNPEIFAATCSSWADIVLALLPKLDKSKMDIVQMIADKFIELNVKEKKNE